MIVENFHICANIDHLDKRLFECAFKDGLYCERTMIGGRRRTGCMLEGYIHVGRTQEVINCGGMNSDDLYRNFAVAMLDSVRRISRTLTELESLFIDDDKIAQMIRSYPDCGVDEYRSAAKVPQYEFKTFKVRNVSVRDDIATYVFVIDSELTVSYDIAVKPNALRKAFKRFYHYLVKYGCRLNELIRNFACNKDQILEYFESIEFYEPNYPKYM